MAYGVGIRLCLLILLIDSLRECDARKRSKPPLIEDFADRRRTRPTHCSFGNQTYEMEERWRPNLGPPFGVLFCVKCECVAIQRKNRIVAKVRCKNIKNDCPKPTCDNPVLQPERCCKTCPGEDLADLEENLAIRKLEPDDEDSKEFSVLMTGKGLKPVVATDITAKGYVTFFKRNLHYNVFYSGAERPTYIRFTDEERNILEEHEISSNFPLLNETKLCGVWRKVPRVYRTLLRKGRLYVILATNKWPEGFLGGKIMKNELNYTNVPITSNCLSESSNNNYLNRNDNYIRDGNSNDIIATGATHKCYYEGEIFDDGAQWKAQHDDCEMCYCQRGRVKCEATICPVLSCLNTTTISGECCPTCLGESMSVSSNTSLQRGCYFEGDKKFHVAGTKWHPYIPPFGFDRCSFCTCLTDTLVIECKRSIVCQPLTCPDHEAYRENPGDCCKQCPNSLGVKSIGTIDQLADQRASGGIYKNPNEILALGGCRFKGRVYSNGDEWHPTVQPFGEVKCVKCDCKDGKIKCKRTKCQRLTCHTVSLPDECCPRCLDPMIKTKTRRRCSKTSPVC